MSGPTTAILVTDPVAVLLSAAGIRAVLAVREGYRHSAELAELHDAEHTDQLKQQQEAIQQEQVALRQQLSQAESEFNQLLQLGGRLGAAEQIQSGRPTVTDDDPATLLRALLGYNAEIKTILMTQSARLPDWDDYQPEFSAASEITVAQRLVNRISHLGTIPQPVQNLLNQLRLDLPPHRRELLENELRQQVQIHLEQSQQHAMQQASALILRHTLKELGYQVQEFSDTLFVEGGVVHFRRHDWGSYMVRLRANEMTHTVNFNVIRAVQDAGNERSVLDHIAEDRWCAEFPALLKALEARGLGLDVTRRLEAGELPVQQVDCALLPTFADIESRRTDTPLKERNLNDR